MDKKYGDLVKVVDVIIDEIKWFRMFREEGKKCGKEIFIWRIDKLYRFYVLYCLLWSV